MYTDIYVYECRRTTLPLEHADIVRLLLSWGSDAPWPPVQGLPPPHTVGAAVASSGLGDGAEGLAKEL